MEPMIERDMRPAVDTWLRGQGCQVVRYESHRVGAGIVDLIGLRYAPRVGVGIPPAELIAVELKMSKIAEVIRQAVLNRYVHDLSWAAMPRDFCDRMRPATLSKVRTAGVGLLAVAGDQVEIVVPALYGRLVDDGLPPSVGSLRVRRYAKGVWSRLSRETRQSMSPTGVWTLSTHGG